MQEKRSSVQKIFAVILAAAMMLSILAAVPGSRVITVYANPVAGGLILPDLPDVSTVNTTPPNVIGTIQLEFAPMGLGADLDLGDFEIAPPAYPEYPYPEYPYPEYSPEYPYPDYPYEEDEDEIIDEDEIVDENEITEEDEIVEEDEIADEDEIAEDDEAAGEDEAAEEGGAEYAGVEYAYTFSYESAALGLETEYIEDDTAAEDEAAAEDEDIVDDEYADEDEYAGEYEVPAANVPANVGIEAFSAVVIDEILTVDAMLALAYGATEILMPLLSIMPEDAPQNAEVINLAVELASALATADGMWEVRFPEGNLYSTYNPARVSFSTPYDVANDAVRYYLDSDLRLWDAPDVADLLVIPTISIELQSNVVVNIPRGTMLQASRIPIHWPRWGAETDVETNNPWTQPRRSVFYGVSLENVTLMGEGIIDGGGGYRSPFIQHGHNQNDGDGPDAFDGIGLTSAELAGVYANNNTGLPWFPDGDWYHPNLRDIYVEGTGWIDEPPTYTGNFVEQGIIETDESAVFHRPQSIIYIRDSVGVQVYHLTLRNSVRWTLVTELNYDVHINGIIIRNPPHWTGRESDGIDINTSSRVIIEYVDIETGDDAICPKPQRDYFQGREVMTGWMHIVPERRYPLMDTRHMHDVLVRHAMVRTNCNAVKIGTGTQVNFTRFHVHDIEIDSHRAWDREQTGELYGTGWNDNLGIPIPPWSDPEWDGRRSRIATAAISVQSNDGGHISHLTFERFTVHEVDTGMFIGHQQRLRDNIYTHRLGSVSNVLFRDINVTLAERSNQINSELYCSVTGDRVWIRNITFDNINHHTVEDWSGATVPPVMNGSYPDADGFGPMPAFGLFARNVDGLNIIGNNTFTGSAIGMQRPMFVFDDVVNFYGADLEQNPPEIAFHIPVHARFPDRAPDYIEQFRVNDQDTYRQFRPWGNAATPSARRSANYWVTRGGNVHSERFSILDDQGRRLGHPNAGTPSANNYSNMARANYGSAFAFHPANNNSLSREYIFLNVPDDGGSLNIPGLPASADWENYHISVRVRASHHPTWREPATTSIIYRAPSGVTTGELGFARDNHIAVNIARSNRGFMRLGGRGPNHHVVPGDHALQIGFADIAHPRRGGPQNEDTPFFQLDIIVDGPFISTYVTEVLPDGTLGEQIEFFRDFYDLSWDIPANRSGTIGLGGNAGAAWGYTQFSDLTVTLINPAVLNAPTATHLEASGDNAYIDIDFRGNYVTRIRNLATNEWLRDGIDFVRTPAGITLNSSYLGLLLPDVYQFELHFNLGGHVVNNEYVREQIFTLDIQADPEVVRHNVSFLSTGDSRGSMDDLEVPDGWTIFLPENNFMRLGYAFVGWRVNGATLLPGESVTVSGEMTITAVWESMVTAPPPPPPRPPAGGQDREAPRGGGAGGGRVAVAPPPAAAAAPSTVFTVTTAPGMTRDAIAAAAPGATPSIRLINPGLIQPAAMQAAVTAAGGQNVWIMGDTLVPGGVAAVDVRIVIDPARVTEPVSLAASTSSPTAVSVRDIFRRTFGGVNWHVVSMEQQVTFGTEVRVATRLPWEADTGNLFFYAYNRQTNTFARFVPTNLWLDNSGYLHFNTTHAGDIVISTTDIPR